MSILNIEELEQNLDYYVFKVAPKIQLFKENLLDKVLSSVIICSDKDCSLREESRYNMPPDVYFIYFDLAQVKEGDYSRIIKKMSYRYENILFDHIDQIPDIPDKEDLEFLVYMALKMDLLPLEQGMCVSELDFSQMMIGAKCSEFPDYLKGKSLQAIFISVNDEL